MQFPISDGRRTRLEFVEVDDGLPVLTWLGVGDTADAGEPVPLQDLGPGLPLLGEHAHARYTRPHLRGHRVEGDRTGGAWSTRFRTDDVTATSDTLRITGHDDGAGLRLVWEAESLAGGGLRLRCTLTNTASTAYVVEGLEVVVPVGDHLTEVLDLTGRHERERSPQRHEVTDGLWLREERGGRPGLEAATLVALGTPHFSTTHGEVVGVHVGWSGNSVLRVERSGATGTTVGGGELLLPGEISLAQGESYATPWVYVAAADDGLDQLFQGVRAAWVLL